MLDTSPLNLVKERAVFADRINTMELEAEDDLYTPSHMNDDVLPEAASELSSGWYDLSLKIPYSEYHLAQENLVQFVHKQ